jgi:osmotically-inducible protein OsmY
MPPAGRPADEAIRAAVGAELERLPTASPPNIGVSANHGVVELSGEVDTLTERYFTVRAAEGVVGVTTVVDHITVVGEPEAVAGDIELAKRISTILEWYQTIPGDQIKAEVVDGAVTLTGSVEWDDHRKAADHAIRSLVGVRSVSNRITLTPRPALADLADQLRATIHRHTELRREPIRVHCEGNEVFLDGTVSTLRARNLASEAAWRHPSVTEVQNRLQVEPPRIEAVHAEREPPAALTSGGDELERGDHGGAPDAPASAAGASRTSTAEDASNEWDGAPSRGAARGKSR